jgi:ATP-dependent RNA helicase DHX37/DHR1
MGPGHCYRIFSSSVYENFFKKFSQPEILRIPIDGVVLNMKAMGMNQVIGFPFPTPPAMARLADAEKMLRHLGALNKEMKITKIGKTMSQFPVHPRYAKMIVACKAFPEVLPYVIAISAGLSVNDIFHRDADLLSEHVDEEMADDEKEARKHRRGQYFKKMAVF